MRLIRPSWRFLLPIVCLAVLAVGLFYGIGRGRPDGVSESVGETTGKNHPAAHNLVSDAKDESKSRDPFPPSYPAWPDAPCEGEPAKQFLLDTLNRLHESFNKIPGYTATFRKQERLKGKLVAEQTFAIKVRQAPFAVYMKATAPTTGKEVIFAKGYFDDKVIAHSDGLSRLIMPKLQVPPEHPLIRSESRHPITNAGIGNLIRNLIGYRELDLRDADAETKLDRWTDPDGRQWLRSIHLHHVQSPDRPFERVEVLYEPETRLPLRYTGFDWPDARSESGISPVLGERYCYDDLTLNAPLTATDFDPANPAYHFHRF